jgi:hypothetical protein
MNRRSSGKKSSQKFENSTSSDLSIDSKSKVKSSAPKKLVSEMKKLNVEMKHLNEKKKFLQKIKEQKQFQLYLMMKRHKIDRIGHYYFNRLSAKYSDLKRVV